MRSFSHTKPMNFILDFEKIGYEVLHTKIFLDKDKLHEFAIDVAQFSTGHFSVKLPTQEFALNARGAPDCAIFDFTNLYSARNACR